MKKVNSGQTFVNVVKESLGRKVHQNQFQEVKQKVENQWRDQIKGNQNFIKRVEMKVDQYSNKRVESMNWEENNCDSSWLEFSLVGVLKSFTDISIVIQGLLNCQIFFTFYYLGDKNVLWLFKSLKDRESFRNNKDLWKDYFSSVCDWTPAITPQARLAWVEFGGVPLDCWCKDLFNRLGWAVGETVLIEEETMDRTTLANGIVLVLIPYGQKCPDVVKVITEKRTFSVVVREDPEPIKYKLILQWLGLDWVDLEGDNSSVTAAMNGVRWDGNVPDQVNEETLAKQPPKSPSSQNRPPKSCGDKEKNNDNEEVERLSVATEALGNGKSIIGCNGMSGFIGGGVNANNEGTALIEDKGDEWNSSSEENALSENSNADLVVGKIINEFMGHDLGGIIIIDLGCGLAQDNRQLTCLGQIVVDQQNLVEMEPRSKKTQSNVAFDLLEGLSKNSMSYVSETLNLTSNGKVVQGKDKSVGRNNKTSRIGSKGLSSCKRHGMVTRKDSSKEVSIQRGSNSLNKRAGLEKGSWNLEAEFGKLVNNLMVQRKNSANIINKGFHGIVGSGERVRFWQDLRWDLISLRNAFPRIYVLAANKEGMVGDLGGGNLLWLGIVPPKIEEHRNLVVFGGKEANLWLAMDSVGFRVACWFKYFGSGSKEDITILLLDLEGRCVDKK
ncbi:hypothetical protein Dsin_012627 [Dipteronia sinensis]|uniref:DUF4283 domain-containing protein n=1 Tax=Dipteronia sinensis TaxID=43782 RepID=A0AAE0AIF3_9ROSI|nr:hypothetical protein Dsin_012627 [Dipteronia sinensis]